MKKFIVVYHAPESAMKKMAKASPEDAKKGMETWMVWAKKVGKGMVDLGTPLGNGKKVIKGGKVKSSNKDVVGYSIIRAEDIDAAVELLKDQPHLQWVPGAEIEVHECLPIPGM